MSEKNSYVNSYYTSAKNAIDNLKLDPKNIDEGEIQKALEDLLRAEKKLGIGKLKSIPKALEEIAELGNIYYQKALIFKLKKNRKEARTYKLLFLQIYPAIEVLQLVLETVKKGNTQINKGYLKKISFIRSTVETLAKDLGVGDNTIKKIYPYLRKPT